MLTLVDGMKEGVFSMDVRMLRTREFVQEGLEIYEGANQNSVSFFFLVLLVTSHCYVRVLLLVLIFNAAFTCQLNPTFPAEKKSHSIFWMRHHIL